MPEVDKYLRETLAAQGWQATTEAPVKMDFRYFVIFRNPTNDLIDVNFTSVEGKTRVLARFQTAEEVARIEQRAREAAERKAREANQPKPTLAVKLPPDASSVEATANRIEFTVPVGQAKAAVESLRKQLVEAGWKETRATIEPMFGDVELSKDNASVSFAYIESGVLAPEITITGLGVELQR
jgi:hypothetical protein